MCVCFARPQVINRGGEILSPFEVEELLAAHDAIDEAMAFAAPHETLQVRPSRGGVCVYVLVSLPRACRAPLAVSSV